MAFTVTGQATVSDVRDGKDGGGTPSRIDVAFATPSGGTKEVQRLDFSGNIGESYPGAAGVYQTTISGDLDGALTAQKEIQEFEISGFIPPSSSGVAEIQNYEVPTIARLRGTTAGTQEVQRATLQGLRNLRGVVAESFSQFQLDYDDEDGFTADQVRNTDIQTLSVVGDGNNQPTIPALEEQMRIGFPNNTKFSGMSGATGVRVPQGTRQGSTIDCTEFGTFTDNGITITGTSSGFNVALDNTFPSGFNTVYFRPNSSAISSEISNYRLGFGSYDSAYQFSLTEAGSRPISAGSSTNLNLFWSGPTTTADVHHDFWIAFWTDSNNYVRVPVRLGQLFVLDQTKSFPGTTPTYVDGQTAGPNTNQWILGYLISGASNTVYDNHPLYGGFDPPPSTIRFIFDENGETGNAAVTLPGISNKDNWLSAGLIGSPVYVNGVDTGRTITAIDTPATLTGNLSNGQGGVFNMRSRRFQLSGSIDTSFIDLDDAVATDPTNPEDWRYQAQQGGGVTLIPRLGLSLNPQIPVFRTRIESLEIDRNDAWWDGDVPISYTNSLIPTNSTTVGALNFVRTFMLNYYNDVLNLEDPSTTANMVIPIDGSGDVVTGTASVTQGTEREATVTYMSVNTGAFANLNNISSTIEGSSIGFRVIRTNGITSTSESALSDYHEYGYLAVTQQGAAEGVGGDPTIVQLYDPGGTLRRTWTSANTGAPQFSQDVRDNVSVSGWNITGSGGQLVFTTTSNIEIDGNWRLVINHQGGDGSLAYVFEQTQIGVPNIDISLTFDWDDTGVGSISPVTVSNTEARNAAYIADLVADRLIATTNVNTNWAVELTDGGTGITFKAKNSNAARVPDLQVLSNNGIYINSKYPFNQTTGSSGSVAETLTVTYTAPTGTTAPDSRTFEVEDDDPTAAIPFSTIFSQIVQDIDGAEDTDGENRWSATGFSSDGVITATRDTVGPITGTWGIALSGTGAGIFNNSGFSEITPGANPITTGESVTYTLSFGSTIIGNLNAIQAGSSDLDAAAIASNIRAQALNTDEVTDVWNVTGTGRSIVLTRKTVGPVTDFFSFTSNNANVPSTPSPSSRTFGVAANGDGRTVFTFTNPEGGSFSRTLTNTSDSIWDGVAIANQLRTNEGTITGWDIQDAGGTNIVRFETETNRPVSGVWTVSVVNTNTANTGVSVFTEAQAGSPGASAQTANVTIAMGSLTDSHALTGPLTASQAAATIAAEIDLTGYTLSSDGPNVRVSKTAIGGSAETFTISTGSSALTGSSFVTVTSPENSTMGAERTVVVSDPNAGTSTQLTMYGPKTSTQAAQFFLENAPIPGWTGTLSSDIITYTANTNGPRDALAVAITGGGSSSNLSASVSTQTNGTIVINNNDIVVPTGTEEDDDYSTATPRATDTYRGERQVFWAVADTEPDPSAVASDYNFVKFVGDAGEEGSDGVDADEVRTIELFQAGLIEPSPPPNTIGAGYSSSTGEAEASVLWVTEPAIPILGYTLYTARREIIKRPGETTWTRNGPWTVSPLSSSGVDGDAGTGTTGASGARYSERTLYTTTPVTEAPEVAPRASIDWSTGAVVVATPGWGLTPPTVATNISGTTYFSVVNFIDTSGEDVTTDATGSSPIAATSFTGAVTFTGGDFAIDGSTITTINGGNITTGSITANQISSDYIYAGELVADRITAGTLSIDRLPGLAIGESATYNGLAITTTNQNLTNGFEGVRAGTRFLMFMELKATSTVTTENLQLELSTYRY